MEAKEFIYGLRRMCNYYNAASCEKMVNGKVELCPAYTSKECLDIGTLKDDMFDIVENWVKEHPAKTRQSEFLKMFPNANMWNNVVNICPKGVDKNFIPNYNCDDAPCCDCIKEYWKEEIK